MFPNKIDKSNNWTGYRMIVIESSYKWYLYWKQNKKNYLLGHQAPGVAVLLILTRKGPWSSLNLLDAVMLLSGMLTSFPDTSRPLFRHMRFLIFWIWVLIDTMSSWLSVIWVRSLGNSSWTDLILFTVSVNTTFSDDISLEAAFCASVKAWMLLPRFSVSRLIWVKSRLLFPVSDWSPSGLALNPEDAVMDWRLIITLCSWESNRDCEPLHSLRMVTFSWISANWDSIQERSLGVVPESDDPGPESQIAAVSPIGNSNVYAHFPFETYSHSHVLMYVLCPKTGYDDIRVNITIIIIFIFINKMMMMMMHAVVRTDNVLLNKTLTEQYNIKLTFSLLFLKYYKTYVTRDCFITITQTET